MKNDEGYAPRPKTNFLYLKFMTAVLLSTIFFVVNTHMFSAETSESFPPQEEKQIKASELLELLKFKSIRGWDYEKAYTYIGKIYAKSNNMSMLPDRHMLEGLAAIVRKYLDSNPGVLNQSAEQAVKEALKDAPAKINAQEVFWENIKKAAGNYSSSPTPENAAELASILPRERVPVYAVSAFHKLLYYLYDQSDFLSILEKQILEAEPRAADVGFLLINLSDGAFAEALVKILGNLIDKDPRLFLQKLLEYHGLTEPDLFELLDSILHPVGWWEAPDDHDEYKKLLNTRIDQRIKLLQGAIDTNLRTMRDTCIQKLKSMRIED